MRLKTIHARTMQEAMELVREQMGAEAVIVATHEDEGTRGVRVTAASDADDRHIPEKERALTFEMLQLIGNALDDHGTPPELADRLLNYCCASSRRSAYGIGWRTRRDIPFSAFARRRQTTTPNHAHRPTGRWQNLGSRQNGGADDYLRKPNSSNQHRYHPRSRRGATAILRNTPRPRSNRRTRSSRIDRGRRRSDPEALVLIDTMGVNPYNFDDMGRLVEFTGAVSVETILVLTAGRDPIEASEIAAAYIDASPTRMLVSGLDMVRRLGGVLAAVDASGLAFSDVSPSPNIVNGLRPVNAVSLARLLLPSSPSETVQEVPAQTSVRPGGEPQQPTSGEPQQEERSTDGNLAPTGSN